MTYQMFILSPENWNDFVQNKGSEFPFKNIYFKTLSKLKVGSKVLVYIKQESKVVGILEVTGPVMEYKFPKLENGNLYDCYVPVKILLTLENDLSIPITDYLRELEITMKTYPKWGISLQKSVVCLTEKDYKFLMDKIENENNEICI